MFSAIAGINSDEHDFCNGELITMNLFRFVIFSLNGEYCVYPYQMPSVYSLSEGFYNLKPIFLFLSYLLF